MKLKVKKLHPDAQLPTQKTGDVGFDLYAVEDACLWRGDSAMIGTGIAIADVIEEPQGDLEYPVPSTIFAKVEGRSGLASKGVF